MELTSHPARNSRGFSNKRCGPTSWHSFQSLQQKPEEVTKPINFGHVDKLNERWAEFPPSPPGGCYVLRSSKPLPGVPSSPTVW